eukprot:Gb_12994 [translate_table: standard]
MGSMEGACVATAAERELARRSHILTRLIERNRAVARQEQNAKPKLPEKTPSGFEPKTSISRNTALDEHEEDLRHLRSLRQEVYQIARKEQGSPTKKKSEKKPGGSEQRVIKPAGSEQRVIKPGGSEQRVVVCQEAVLRKKNGAEDEASRKAVTMLVRSSSASSSSDSQSSIIAKCLPLAVVEVNLAAVAVELKVRVKAADMPALLQEQAFRCARQCLDGMQKLNSKRVALALKKEFDASYGPAWHCIVGTSFGSFVTHSLGGFLYFSMDKVSVLLFKTAVEPLDQ